MPSLTNGSATGPAPVPTATGEPRFYHYCYVCNTQLNSCKQALLHCSGKRHRKKLQFLQARKHAVAPLPSNGFGPGTSAGSGQNGPTGTVPPLPTGSPALFPAGGFVAAGEMPGAIMPSSGPSGQPANGNPAGFFPIPAGAPNDPGTPPGAAPGGSWVQVVQSPTGPAGAHPLPPGSRIIHLNHPIHEHPHSHAPQNGYPGPGQLMNVIAQVNGMSLQGHQANPMAPGFPHGTAGSHSSSPLLLTDSSYSGGLRSAVISPSDTSSISSDPSQPSQRRLINGVLPGGGTPNGIIPINNGVGAYRCAVCLHQFPTGALLHQHLQQARHFKHHNHSFSAGDPTIKPGDSSETESSNSNSLHYCSVCSIAVNSQAQLQSHNNGSKHRQRVSVSTGVKGQSGTTSAGAPGASGNGIRHSRSSSTSSELAQYDVTAESGYTSGSGDDSIRRVLDTNGNVDVSQQHQFYCQPCNVYFESQTLVRQHIESARHVQRVSSSRPPFRRKAPSSFRRKSANNANTAQANTSDSSTAAVAESSSNEASANDVQITPKASKVQLIVPLTGADDGNETDSLSDREEPIALSTSTGGSEDRLATPSPTEDRADTDCSVNTIVPHKVKV